MNPCGENARALKAHGIVLCFLFPSCAPAGRFFLNASEGKPHPTLSVPATRLHSLPCRRRPAPANRRVPSLYGTACSAIPSEVESGRTQPTRRARPVQCATDEIGIS